MRGEERKGDREKVESGKEMVVDGTRNLRFEVQEAIISSIL